MALKQYKDITIPPESSIDIVSVYGLTGKVLVQCKGGQVAYVSNAAAVSADGYKLCNSEFFTIEAAPSKVYLVNPSVYPVVIAVGTM